MDSSKAVDILFGQRLSELRRSAGVSTLSFAFQLGISPQELDDIEQGNSRATPQVLEQAARALGVPITALVPVAELAAAADAGKDVVEGMRAEAHSLVDQLKTAGQLKAVCMMLKTI